MPSVLRGRRRKSDPTFLIIGGVVGGGILLAGVLFLLLSGGSIPGVLEARIDATTAESCKASIEAMRVGMNADELKAFEKDLMLVAMNGDDDDAEPLNIFQLAQVPGAFERNIRDNLHGKTRSEIRALAKTIRAKQVVAKADRQKEKIAELRDNIDELKAEKRKNASERAGLSAIRLKNARLVPPNRERFQLRMFLSAELTNGLDKALSAVQVRVIVRSPGREVPWADERIYGSFQGGVEPGETAEFSGGEYELGLVPEDRDDLQLTITVEQAYGANDKRLFPDAFGRDEHLAKLQQQLAELVAN